MYSGKSLYYDNMIHFLHCQPLESDTIQFHMWSLIRYCTYPVCIGHENFQIEIQVFFPLIKLQYTDISWWHSRTHKSLMPKIPANPAKTYTTPGRLADYREFSLSGFGMVPGTLSISFMLYCLGFMSYVFAYISMCFCSCFSPVFVPVLLLVCVTWTNSVYLFCVWSLNTLSLYTFVLINRHNVRIMDFKLASCLPSLHFTFHQWLYCTWCRKPTYGGNEQTSSMLWRDIHSKFSWTCAWP